jgi:hypothetical protein
MAGHHANLLVKLYVTLTPRKSFDTELQGVCQMLSLTVSSSFRTIELQATCPDCC